MARTKMTPPTRWCWAYLHVIFEEGGPSCQALLQLMRGARLYGLFDGHGNATPGSHIIVSGQADAPATSALFGFRIGDYDEEYWTLCYEVEEEPRPSWCYFTTTDLAYVQDVLKVQVIEHMELAGTDTCDALSDIIRMMRSRPVLVELGTPVT